jgi:hypothetical protein
MAERCRMKTNTVEEILQWLEVGKHLTIHRKAGKVNRYELQWREGLVYIDHRLDDAGLSQIEIRVLGHITRIADDETGGFFINKSKFAEVCRMQRETICLGLDSLEDRGICTPYADRKNPMYILTLNECFPKPVVTVTDNSCDGMG